MTTPTPTPRTDALIRFEFGPTDQPFPAHALLAMIQLSRELERDLAVCDAKLAEARMALQRANTPIANVTLSGDAEYWKQRAEMAERKAEEAARDSERYRWLRNKARLEYMNPKAMEDSRMEWNFPKLFGMTCVMTEIPIDEAVDAAIAAKVEA